MASKIGSLSSLAELSPIFQKSSERSNRPTASSSSRFVHFFNCHFFKDNYGKLVIDDLQLFLLATIFNSRPRFDAVTNPKGPQEGCCLHLFLARVIFGSKSGHTCDFCVLVLILLLPFRCGFKNTTGDNDGGPC